MEEKIAFSRSFNGYNPREVDAWWSSFHGELAEAKEAAAAAVSEAESLRVSLAERDAVIDGLRRDLDVAALALPPEEALAAFPERQRLLTRQSSQTARRVIESAREKASGIVADAQRVREEAERDRQSIIAEGVAEVDRLREELGVERSEWEREAARMRSEWERELARARSDLEDEAARARADIAREDAEAKARRDQGDADFRIADAERRQRADRACAQKFRDTDRVCREMVRDAREYVERCESRGDAARAKTREALDHVTAVLASLDDLPSILSSAEGLDSPFTEASATGGKGGES